MRYTGPKCKLCRREGVQLFLKGDRCRTQKCSALRKNYPPGQHGKLFGKKSEYGKQLREKQKAKRIFGISEAVMKSYYDKATKMPGDTSENLLRILSLRFDNIIYLSGFTESRNTARQLITHGFFQINEKRSKTPSTRMKKGDKVVIKSDKKNDAIFGELGKKKIITPNWLKVNHNTINCEVLDPPEGKALQMNIDAQLIIGFYSR